MRRIKLNDKVTFPEILDMNNYIEGHKIELLDEDDEFTFGDAEKREQVLQEALTNGPYVYELFSILIHGGSALGGHYFAYIKSFEKNEWYCFNDSSVYYITPTHIKETFGGTSRGGMGNYSSGVNAYMLMYRKIDLERNIPEPSNELISDEVN